jgi:hypothetical protein
VFPGYVGFPVTEIASADRSGYTHRYSAVVARRTHLVPSAISLLPLSQVLLTVSAKAMSSMSGSLPSPPASPSGPQRGLPPVLESSFTSESGDQHTTPSSSDGLIGRPTTWSADALHIVDQFETPGKEVEYAVKVLLVSERSMRLRWSFLSAISGGDFLRTTIEAARSNNAATRMLACSALLCKRPKCRQPTDRFTLVSVFEALLD